MDVTVAICTRNRAQLLRQTLEQMTRLRIPDGIDWELLVVDNNSTDSTEMRVAEFSTRLPVRLLFEPKPGKSHALNLAVREAAGDYIAFTDDDVLVDEDWLVEYGGAFRRWPEATVFGGPIDAWIEGQLPAWLHRVWPRVKGVYGVLPPGDGRVEYQNGPGPFGANMAVRTRDQRRYPYDPQLARQPGSPMRGEETAVVQAMLRDGLIGRWVPSARVRHFIPKSRQTIASLREHFFGLGLYDGLHDDFRNVPKLVGRPRWAWRQAIEGELRYWIGRLVRKPELWVEGLMQSGFAWGTIRGYGDRTKGHEAGTGR